MQGIIDHGYDGNVSWAAFGLFSLFGLCHIVLRARQKRRTGYPVVVREVAFATLLFLGFAVLAFVEILSHG